MRKRQKRLSSISEIMGGTDSLRMGDNLKRYTLWDRWPSIVGRDIARHARPARWQGKTLVVRVEHPTWIQELNFLKHEMLKRIQGSLAGTAIKDIRFEVGSLPEAPKPEPKRAGTAARPRELTPDEEEFVDQASGEIADPEIRDAASRAMSRSFSAKKKSR